MIPQSVILCIFMDQKYCDEVTKISLWWQVYMEVYMEMYMDTHNATKLSTLLTISAVLL